MTDLLHIVDQMKQERDRIDTAINILEGGGAKVGRPRKGTTTYRRRKGLRRGPRRLSAASRRRISAIAKARWAQAKKAGRNSL